MRGNCLNWSLIFMNIRLRILRLHALLCQPSCWAPEDVQICITPQTRRSIQRLRLYVSDFNTLYFFHSWFKFKYKQDTKLNQTHKINFTETISYQSSSVSSVIIASSTCFSSCWFFISFILINSFFFSCFFFTFSSFFFFFFSSSSFFLKSSSSLVSAAPPEMIRSQGWTQRNYIVKLDKQFIVYQSVV